MYIVDDICYAGNQADEIRVESAKPLRGGMLLVTFTNGEKKLFDTTKLTGAAFEPLRDDEIFKKLSVFHGVITWMNGEIDIAPETVYAQGYPYESDDIQEYVV
jgi:hypothetical protein